MLGLKWTDQVVDSKGNVTEHGVAAFAGEHSDPLTDKPLAGISEKELDKFNADLNAIAAQYASDPVRAALEKYQRECLVLARRVMKEASQPYGGGYATGSEIVGRALAPVDLAFTLEEIWDLDLTGRTIGDIYGYQTGAGTPANDTITQYEGNIILGFISEVPLPGFAKYQFIKAGKTYGYFPMNFWQGDSSRLKFAPVMAPLMEFPLDSVRIHMDVARTALNPDRTIAVGIHYCRASAITSATGSA